MNAAQTLLLSFHTAAVAIAPRRTFARAGTPARPSMRDGQRRRVLRLYRLINGELRPKFSGAKGLR
jgi:hypothetical protein